MPWESLRVTLDCCSLGYAVDSDFFGCWASYRSKERDCRVLRCNNLGDICRDLPPISLAQKSKSLLIRVPVPFPILGYRRL